MLAHEAFDLVEFILRETPAEFQPHRLQPELRFLALAGHMYVRWFAPIARIEEETVGAALENRRTHAWIVSGSELGCHVRRTAQRVAMSRGALDRGGAAGSIAGLDVTACCRD